MLPLEDACDDGCALSSLHSRLGSRPMAAVALSSLPFLFTFFAVGLIVHHRVFPLLSNQGHLNGRRPDHKVSKSDVSFRSTCATAGNQLRPTSKRVAAITFSITIALSAVLAELIFCEISNTLDPAARTLSLRLTLSTLLILLIVVIPLLQLHSIITSAGWTFSQEGRRPVKLAWLLAFLGFAAWISGFWWVGQSIPGTHVHNWGSNAHGSLSEACLERIGVIGISLMALLSGFASVSSPWQNFGTKDRPVTESDIDRKQAGLEATVDMLEAKQSRLRALSRKMSDAPAEGFMTKVMGSIRGNADVQERKSLELEISGLETMRLSLSTSLAVFHDRRRNQQRASTSSGRLLLLISYLFSLYCVYRIIATSVASLRRWWRPETTFAGTDPINNFLALIAKHWDPSLDRLAWSRQISFLLSGVILLASFSSVLQTFLLFSRFTPKMFHHAQGNLALVVGQVSATYVISSALLLRSNLPSEVGSVISDALGAPLDSAFVDRWFEGWFLTASGLTALGIVLGRKLGGSGDWDDFGEDVEMGKRS